MQVWRWAVFCLGLTASAAAAEPPHLALVIGNSAYAGLPPVPACEASAGVVASTLRRAGFAVTDLLDPSNGRMGATIAAFGDALAQAPGAVAVVYACGYAIPFEGRVFLMPASTRLERDTDTLTQGIVAGLLVRAVTGAEIGAGLVLLETVAQPGGRPLSPAALLPAATGTKGVLVAHNTAVPPGGPTALAAAVASAFRAPTVELGAALTEMRGALQGAPRLEVQAQRPTASAWLVGGPVVAALPTPAPEPQPPPEPRVAEAIPAPEAAASPAVAPSAPETPEPAPPPAPAPALAAPATPIVPEAGPVPRTAATAEAAPSPPNRVGTPVPTAEAPATVAVAPSAPEPAPPPAAAPAPAPAVTASATPSAPQPAPSPVPAPEAAATTMVPSNALATYTDADRRRVQAALAHLGYYGGRVDGVFGPESLAATRRYQHELGAEMTGRLTIEQFRRLTGSGS